MYASVCTAYYTNHAEPFLTDKELRITIYGKHDNTPYYYSPYENVTAAQQITACSSTNFDETDQTLKENTEMCYGKNNNDMIIITKRFAGFYGAADTVAQSSLRLKAPASYSTSPTLAAIAIISNTSNTTGYTVDGEGNPRTTYTHAVNSADAIGDLFLVHPVQILSNPFFSGINDESDPCGGIVASLAELPASNVPGFAIPDNIAPKTKSSLVGLGLNFHNGTSGPPCSPDPEALSSNPLITGKEIRFTLYNQSDKSPYYFSPRDSILAAQPIPLCTTINFNTTTQTLKGDNSMCSGKNGAHMIILTKRLFGFYGVADTVTPPTHPVNLTIGAPSPDPSTPVTPDPTDPPLPAGTIKIPPPDGFPTTFRSDHIIFTTSAASNAAQMTTPKADVRGKSGSFDFGDIFVQNGTRIVSNPGITSNGQCNFVVDSIYGFIWFNRLNTYPLPTNVQPNLANGTRAAIDEIVAVGFHENSECNSLLHNSAAPPLITDKELRVTIYDEYDKKPYFFSKRANMTEAQQIPACSSTNYDSTTQTLKDDTKMCAGVNGTNMVIITKRFTGFYGAADTITAPATPIDLDAGGAPDPSTTTVDPISRDNVKGINSSTYALFNITTTAAGTASIDATGKYTYSGAITVFRSSTLSGHIYIPPNTIISSSVFVADDIGKPCVRGYVHPSDSSDSVALPDGVSNITAYGFSYTNPVISGCILQPINVPTQQLDVNNVLQVVLYDQAGKHGYSYDRKRDITTAQYIAPCDTTNFNSATKALRNNVKMCYADVGTDLVIYTKVMRSYGANETPLDPPGGAPDPSTTVDSTAIMTLNPLPNTPKVSEIGSMNIYKESNELQWYIASNPNHTANIEPTGPNSIGHLFIPGPWPNIELNPALPTTGQMRCDGSIDSVKEIITPFDEEVQGLRIPDNIEPKNKKKIIAGGVNWYETTGILTQGGKEYTDCPAHFDHNNYTNIRPLITEKELIWTLYNQHDKKAYYFSPRANITQAQPIPICTTSTIDTTTLTLKGDTKMCYGKHEKNMVIVTKTLTGFYGAADKVIVPIAPPSSADPQYRALMINSRSDATTGYFSSSGSFTNGPSNRIGDIYIPPNTLVLSNPVLYNSVSSCTLAVNTLKDIPLKRIQDLKVPDNIKPKQKGKTIAMGFDIYQGNKVNQKCSPDLEEPSTYPLLTDKPLRFTLYNQSDKKPYYISPRDDIKKAQPIRECSSTNYDFATQTLEGDTKMCYGVNGDHLVIMTKRLLGFYGAANRVDTPNPIDLDTAGSPVLKRVFVLTPPDNSPDPTFTSIAVISDSGVRTGYINTSSSNGHTLTHSAADRIGSIFIPHQPKIPANDIFTTARSECNILPIDINAALNNNYVPGLVIPDNIKPNTTNSLAALGFDMYSGSDKSVQCSPDLESNNNTAPLLLDKEIRFTLFGKYDKTPYYISPRDNITAAKSIPACTSTTLHLSNQSLQKGTFMCYGTYENHTVIITKRLSGFYGAADTVNGKSANDSPDMDEIRSRDNIKGIGTQVPFRITTESAGTATIEVSGKYTYSPAGTTQMGHIYIPPSTTISNDLFVAADAGKPCVLGRVLSSEYTSTNAELFKLPDDVSDGIAYGFGYSANTLDNPAGCNLNGNTDVDPPLDVDTVLQIVLYDQANKQGYSYLRTDNINTSQYVPSCNTGNFDSTTKTLIGDTKHCYTNAGDDLLIYATIMQWYGAKPFDDDGMSTAPTFGTSPLTGEQLVTCGYKMDDTCRDITAYHVQYERDTIQTNTTHTFALKALAPNMIDSFTLAFGVPEIGSPVSAAEAYITAKLAVNYTSPSYYNIVQVTVHDPNNIIDYDIANTEIARVSCSGGTLECAQVTFPDVLFRETLYHEPFVVMITDTLLYTSINYMNEGILVTGTPLNEQPTISPGITVDTGDIRPTKLVLVRTDKVNDLWADAFGNTWSRNSFGNYVIVQYAPYAGTVPVCSDINDRLCAPFKAKLDWHNQRMIELRDSLYTAYTTKAYAEIDDIFTYEFGDMDSRTRTLINLGWLTE